MDPQAIIRLTMAVTKKWARQVKSEEKSAAARARRKEAFARPKRMTIKDAAYKVIEEMYLVVSNNKQYPALARQIMYRVRPKVLQLTGGRCWKRSQSFTQGLLPDFMKDHPRLTADWDVVFDSRGHFAEPHTGRRVDLGGMPVRKYIASWTSFSGEAAKPEFSRLYPNNGPANRFAFALFVEKEGFDVILESAHIATRFDIAVMSTKGMSVTAARKLVERLSEEGVTILVLRDFDRSGFSIIHTLRSNTRRYKFKKKPNVIDLGLRLEDVRRMGLEAEEVTYASNKNPRERLRECGATWEECDFLVRSGAAKRWRGKRVELNEMINSQFIQFVEAKLTEHGVEKVVPDEETLAKAHLRVKRLAHIQKAIDAAWEEAEKLTAEVPADLREKIREEIRGKSQPWDVALWRLAAEDDDESDDGEEEGDSLGDDDES